MTTPTAPTTPTTAPAAEVVHTIPHELWVRLLDALALPADTTDPEMVALAVEDAVTTPATPVPTAASAGLVGVDPGTLAALRRDAEQGRAIAAAAVQRERTQLVAAAVSAGRITPARREHWVTVLAADPGMADTLASLPAGLVPMVEVGYSGAAEVSEPTEPAAWFHA